MRVDGVASARNGPGEIVIAHEMPGRLRLRLCDGTQPVESLLATLRGIPGVRQVRHHPISRSLILNHEGPMSRDRLASSIATTGFALAAAPEPPTQPKPAAPECPVRIAHAAVPGRLRLQITSLRDESEEAVRLEQRIQALSGVETAEYRQPSGSLVVRYDPARQTVRTLVDTVSAMLDGAGSPRESPEGVAPDRRPPCERYRWFAAADTEQTLAELGVKTRDGLSEEEARRRAEALGSRALEPASRRPAADILREQFVTVPTGLLAVGMAFSLLTAGLLDATAIGVVLLINGVVGYCTERHAEHAIEALRRLGHPRARVFRGGALRVLPADELVPGDVVRLMTGDLVPGDARLLEGTLLLDEAMLTGESEPVSKHAEPTAAPARAHEFRNVVFHGTSVLDGRARAVVMATGKDTELGRVHGLVRGTTAPRTQLQDQLDALGKRLGLGAAGIGTGLFGIGLLRGRSLVQTLETTVSLTVSAVPEGLPAVATTALAVGMNRMLKRQVIIRKLPAVEALGSVTVLCVDKTGTLTLNRMTATEYWTGGRTIGHSTGKIRGTGRFLEKGAVIAVRANPSLDAMLRVGVLCSEARLWDEGEEIRVSGSPTESALLLAANAGGYSVEGLRDEYPMEVIHRRNENHLRMATAHRRPGGGILVAVKGSPEAVMELCAYVLDENGSRVPLTEEERERAFDANRRMSENGLRVLGFACGEKEAAALQNGYLEKLTWLGLVGLEDPIRPGVSEAIDRCREAGVRTVILTGDQRGTALAVARQLQLGGEDAAVLEAGDLERMSPQEIARTLHGTSVYARVSPADKLRIVQALQSSGQVVAMTGDGVNDGPALKAADIGIAMGDGSSDVARELADIVLTRNDFEALVAAVEQGRGIFANIRRALRYLVCTNIADLALAATTMVAGIPFPLTPLQILWLNLISDVFPALALILEPTDSEVMRRPPRRPGTPILACPDWKSLGWDAGAIFGASLSAYLWAALRYGFGPVASSVAFTALTLAEILYVFACSSARGQGRGHSSVWMAAAASVGVQLAVNHWRPLQRILRTSPLGVTEYAVAAAAALAPTLFSLARTRLARAALPASAERTGDGHADRTGTARPAPSEAEDAQRVIASDRLLHRVAA